MAVGTGDRICIQGSVCLHALHLSTKQIFLLPSDYAGCSWAKGRGTTSHSDGCMGDLERVAGPCGGAVGVACGDEGSGSPSCTHCLGGFLS